MKISERKIDPMLVEEGGWVSDIPDWDDLKLKLRGANNKQWQKMDQTLSAAVPRKRKRQDGALDPEDRRRITRILVRDTCLLDWRNFQGEDGQLVPFSKEEATKYLMDPQWELFFNCVFQAALVVGEHGKAVLEDDAGN